MTGGQHDPTRIDSGRTPAVFLDRDGTINVEKNYLHQIGDWEWIDGAKEAICRFNEAGFKVVVVSNQAGIARGMFVPADVEKLHAFVGAELQTTGAWIDAFYYCPHHPEGTIKPLAVRCRCRKPAPGMLEQAAREWRIDTGASFLIGDKDDDMAAAAAFNIRGVKFSPQTDSLVDVVRQELAKSSGSEDRLRS